MMNNHVEKNEILNVYIFEKDKEILKDMKHKNNSMRNYQHCSFNTMEKDEFTLELIL